MPCGYHHRTQSTGLPLSANFLQNIPGCSKMKPYGWDPRKEDAIEVEHRDRSNLTTCIAIEHHAYHQNEK